MSAARQIAAADRRLAIVMALSLAPGYTLPRRQMRAQIEAIGYRVSLDLLESDLAWLDEMGLADRRDPSTGSGDHVTLTDRGLDVAQSRAEIPGVRRPEPGEV